MTERPTYLNEPGKLFYIDKSSLSLKGRVQSVITSKESPWAVRNLKKDRKGLKTEPHIEAGLGIASENLFKFCYQGNVVSHIFSDERFLFLLTVCRNPDFPEKFGKRLINGYIDKRGYGYQDTPRGKRFFVFGEPFVVGFKDAIPVEEIGFNPFIRVQLVDEEKTKKIMQRLMGVPNSTDEYIKEIERLDPKGLTCVLTQGQTCIFGKTCLRNTDFLKSN
jgi:hypothetical protein